MRWMAANCVIYTDPNDNIKVKKQQAANKIDGDHRIDHGAWSDEN